MRLSGALAVLAVFFVFIVFVLPTPVARFVISAQLEQLGMEHDGIDTIDIDLWNSEVRAGPLVFRAGDGEDGQIGETGFDYSFAALLQGRAFIQTFYLRGVDIYISRLNDGAIELNGLNLSDLGGSQEEPSEDENGEEEGGLAFGVENFEFTDSRLFFEDLSGGTLEMDLERLTIQHLISWTPEQPTEFSLGARLNEIDISVEGTLLPLADPLEISAQTRIEGVTLDRVARFVGETGLARQGGTLESEVDYDYKLFDSGLIEGTVEGIYRLTNADIETAEGDSVTLDEATLNVSLAQSLQPDGSLRAEGSLALNGGALSLKTLAGDTADLGGLTLTLEGVDLIKSAQRRERLLDPETPEGGATPQDRAASLIELMIGWARDIGQNILAHQVEMRGRPTLDLEDARLSMAARDGVAAQSLSLDSLSLDLGQVATTTYDRGLDLELGLQTLIQGLALDAGAGAGRADELELTSEQILMTIDEGRTALDFDIAAEARGVTGGAANAQGALQSLSIASEGFSIQGAGVAADTAEPGEASGPLSLALNGLEATLPGETGPLSLSADQLSLELTPLRLSEDAVLSAAVAGVLSAGGLSAERGGGEPLSITVSSLRSQLNDLALSPLAPDGRLRGGMGLDLSDIAARLGAADQAVSVQVGAISNTASGIEASGFDAAVPDFSLANETRIDDLSTQLPLSSGELVTLTLQSLTVDLSELRGSADGGSLAGRIDSGAFSAITDAATPQTLDLASLSITDISGGSREGISAEAVEIGDVRATVVIPSSTADVAAEPAQADGPDKPGNEGTAAEDQKLALPDLPIPLRIGAVTLSPGSTVKILDPSQEPPLEADLRFDELSIAPIDSSAPDTRSEVALSALFNENTAITLDGWAKPFKTGIDLDLSSRIESLQLPVFSSYAAKAVGFGLESGSLTTEVGAAADAGALDGNIGLRIDDLFVTPISAEEAERLKANVGVPVGFAVGVLKDSEGVIELNFPLSGSLASPDVDYSEAINKAISGAMASLFPTNWFGEGGEGFEMQPATFVPGTLELTEDGRAVADHFGNLFSQRPSLSIRACGRAGRADLVVLRGGTPEAPPAVAPETGQAADTQAADPDTSGGEAESAPSSEPPSEPPSDQEVEALLGLATQRGRVIREYLAQEHGLDPDRLPECRTTYSIDDGLPPRAEFQF